MSVSSSPSTFPRLSAAPSTIPYPYADANRHAVASNIEGAAISVTLLAFLAVVLRFWSRTKSRKGLGWDDWLIIPALMLAFGSLAAVIIMAKNGMGLPMPEISGSELYMLAKALITAEFVYIAALTLTKISILIMYCRAFELRSIRIGAWIINALVFVWGVVNITVWVLQCSPLDQRMPSGNGESKKCFSGKYVFIANAVPEIVIDAMILALPSYHVWKLHLPRLQRLTLLSVFLMGCLVVVISIWRMVIVMISAREGVILILKECTIWSHIEVCIAIVSACLPCLRPLLKHLCVTCGYKSRSNDNVGSVGTIGGRRKSGHIRATRSDELDFDTLACTPRADSIASHEALALPRPVSNV